MGRAAAVAAGIPTALDVDTSAAPSDAGRAHPRPWLRAMGRATAVAADTNGTDHCLGRWYQRIVGTPIGQARPTDWLESELVHRTHGLVGQT